MTQSLVVLPLFIMKNIQIPPWFLYNLFMAFIKLLEKFMNKVSPPIKMISDTLFSFFKIQIIHAAVEHQILDALGKEPMNLTRLAQERGLSEEILHRLMKALCSLDVVRETKDREYVIAPMGEILQTDHPYSLRSHVLWFSREGYRTMGGLSESIKTGKTVFPSLYGGNSLYMHLDKNKKSAEIFDSTMTEATRGLWPFVLADCDFSSFKHIVDIGGGEGQVIRAILEKYPDMRGTLFDQPSVIEKARPDSELLKRCDLVAGDFFKSIPDNGDLYLLKAVIHNWSDEDATAVLSNCHRAMRKGDRLVLVETIIRPQEDDWLRLSVDLLMLSMLGAKERNEQEYRTLLQAAGFNLTKITATRSFLSIIEAEPIIQPASVDDESHIKELVH